MAARFTAAADGALSPAMQAAWARDGYLLLEDFVVPAAIDALCARTAELVAAFDPAESQTIFSTAGQEHAQDRYFSESGDRIRFFFEADAAGKPKELGLNKIGHAMHDLDPVFDRFSRTPRLAALTRSLGFARPLILQSQYIFKQPFIGGEVDWHQDSCFLYTEPLSVVGYWFALEDATRDNGCLAALPGGHKGALRKRFRREGEALVMDELDASPWPAIAPEFLEAPRGSLVLLHGLLPHHSAPNRSPASRHAYTIHVIDGAASYPADNWLMRPGLPLRGF